MRISLEKLLCHTTGFAPRHLFDGVTPPAFDELCTLVGVPDMINTQAPFWSTALVKVLKTRGTLPPEYFERRLIPVDPDIEIEVPMLNQGELADVARYYHEITAMRANRYSGGRSSG